LCPLAKDSLSASYVVSKYPDRPQPASWHIKAYDVKKILSKLGFSYSMCKSSKASDFIIEEVGDLKNATDNDLAFCSYDDVEKCKKVIAKCNAKVILCHRSLEGLISPKSRKGQSLIFVDNPRLAVMRVINEIYYSVSATANGVNKNHPNTLTKPILPVTVISKSAKIGNYCSFGNFTTIDDNCIIGDHTIIGDRVTILKNTTIGRNCIIQPGTVIGADGFAYERLEATLELQRFPHIGGVTIKDNVEICSNCSIARGSLSDTIIEEGTKLDALVHVAHNVEIGKNCALTAGTIIGGSTRIGNLCWTGLNSTIKHKVTIGNSVIIGSGASVINDIDDEDIVAGVPARSIKHKVKSSQLFLMAGHRKRATKRSN
jgi:UDP-3-O-[3-hydroxymyristoyl] glucosamine N-acyltransferase